MKAHVAVLAVLVFAVSAHAQTGLKEQCQSLVERFDTANAKQRAKLDDYQRLVTANKAKATETVVGNQMQFESELGALFLANPLVKSYVTDFNTLTAEQRHSELIKVLRAPMYQGNLQPQLREAAKGLAGDGTTVDVLENGAVQLSRIEAVGDLKLRMVGIGHLEFQADGSPILMISTSAWAHDAPRYVTMTNGMKILNLADGRSLVRVGPMRNWGGLLERTIVEEPYSKWETSIAKMGVLDDPDEVRACRPFIK